MQRTFQILLFVVLLLLSVSFGPWAGVSADDTTVDAPDFKQEGVDTRHSFIISQNEDGSTDFLLGFHYADREDNLDSKSDFRYQSDEGAYNQFQRSVNETVDALVRASEEATGRDITVTYTGTKHTSSEDSVHYRFSYNIKGLAVVDGEKIALSEPLSSNHPIFSREDSNVYVRGPNKRTVSQEYHVSNITDKHSQYLIETDPDHSYPTSVELQGHEMTDFEGFSVVFEPVPDETATPTPTSTDSPTATATSTQTESSAESGFNLPLISLIILITILLLATVMWVRSDN